MNSFFPGYERTQIQPPEEAARQLESFLA